MRSSSGCLYNAGNYGTKSATGTIKATGTAVFGIPVGGGGGWFALSLLGTSCPRRYFRQSKRASWMLSSCPFGSTTAPAIAAAVVPRSAQNVFFLGGGDGWFVFAPSLGVMNVCLSLDNGVH